jgi:rod shape-determining protein MreD
MRKIVFISVFVFLFALSEFVLFNLGGRWLQPNFLLVFIIFIDLLLGIRYAIVTALLAGLLKDSFGIGVFGVYLLSFLAAAYLTVFIKKYIYMSGSRFSRVFLVGIVTVSFLSVQYLLLSMFQAHPFFETVRSVFLPQTLLTAVSANFIMERLKRCALKFCIFSS